jgi:hypothetical protein
LILLHYSGYRFGGGDLTNLTRVQIEVISEIQRFIADAKQGKIKEEKIVLGKVPVKKQLKQLYTEECSEPDKKRWLAFKNRKR